LHSSLAGQNHTVILQHNTHIHKVSPALNQFYCSVDTCPWLHYIPNPTRTMHPYNLVPAKWLTHTHVPLSPSSIIWYQWMGGDAFQLGRYGTVTVGLASHWPRSHRH